MLHSLKFTDCVIPFSNSNYAIALPFQALIPVLELLAITMVMTRHSVLSQRKLEIGSGIIFISHGYFKGYLSWP